MKTYTVYVHIFPNDKLYIGITSRLPEVRWGEYGEKYTCKNIRSAIQHYGWQNVRHIILFEGISEELACIIEEYLIAKYHTTDRRFGYNSSTGGKVNRGYTYVRSDESKQRASEKMLEWHKNHPEFKDLMRSINCGKIRSEETRKKLSESHKGQVPYMKGKHHTEETKAKMRASHQAHPNVISDWQKQRISEANKGREISDDIKQKISEANKGRKFTDEHKRKLSEAKIGKTSPRKGKHLSDETKEKLRQANVGKKLDESTRQRMSEAQKKRWSKR